MRVLITGGAGFIGSHLAETYLGRGDEVHVVDDLSTGKIENINHFFTNSRFSYTICSVFDSNTMDKLIKNTDIILHLASAVGVQYVLNNPLTSLKTTLYGTELVLSLADKYSKKILIVSTSEVYGKNGKEFICEDDDRIIGSTTISRWSYGCAKAVGEFMAIAYSESRRLPIIIVRLFNVVGPRQTDEYGMVIPRFVQLALRNEPLTVYGDGSQRRTFTYIKDTVKAIMLLMEEKKALGNIFNVGSSDEISINDLAQIIIDKTKSESKIVFLPYSKVFKNGFEDMMRRVPDLTKINSIVGYQPEYKLDEMLDRIIEYFHRKNKLIDMKSNTISDICK